MKFRRQLAALVAVAMMIGCMPGFVFATETEESQIPTEESEQTEEVQEDQHMIMMGSLPVHMHLYVNLIDNIS